MKWLFANPIDMRSFSYILLICLPFWTVKPLWSQPQHVVDSIPEVLLSNANAVIRTAQYRFTLLNVRHSRLNVKVAVTLLNDNADKLHVVGLPYDKFRNISGISARAFDASGKLIWNLRKFNIADRSDFTGPDKLSDARRKVFEVPSFNYPFTLEYVYSMKMKDLFLSPDLYFQPEHDISVQETGVVFIIPEGLGFRYKSYNLRYPMDSTRRKGHMVYSWKETDLPARHTSEQGMGKTAVPVLYATPLQFEQAGYMGGCSTWQEYGTWIAQINEGLDELDSKSAEMTRRLVAQCVDRQDTIGVLYEHMQKNTHYFYTGLGIGGTKPIPAAEVAKYGYGDCKALSNYMKAMLKTVGIESWYTLVKSGKGERLASEIPCSQFDHVILCVPSPKDTLWLECTDPSIPFGFLGSFTCDREVLAITPEGGRLLHTPSYGVNENRIILTGRIKLQKSGDAIAEIKIRSTGLACEELFKLSEKAKEERKKTWTDLIGCPLVVEVETYRFENNRIPVAEVHLKLVLHSLVPVTTSRVFISPSLLSDLTPGSKSLPWSGFQQTDSVWIELPEFAKPEYLPGILEHKDEEGSHRVEIQHQGGELLLLRRREVLRPAKG